MAEDIELLRGLAIRLGTLGETAVDCTLSICLTFDLSAAGLADFQVLSDAAIVPFVSDIPHWSPCHAPPLPIPSSLYLISFGP